MKHSQKLYLIKSAGILDQAQDWIRSSVGIKDPNAINAALGGAAAFVPSAIAGVATDNWKLPILATLAGGAGGYFANDANTAIKGYSREKERQLGEEGRNIGRLAGGVAGAAAIGPLYVNKGTREAMAEISMTGTERYRKALAAQMAKDQAEIARGVIPEHYKGIDIEGIQNSAMQKAIDAKMQDPEFRKFMETNPEAAQEILDKMQAVQDKNRKPMVDASHKQLSKGQRLAAHTKWAVPAGLAGISALFNSYLGGELGTVLNGGSLSNR